MDKGLLIVVSGPSGAGKGTVMKELMSGGDYALSVSATTRSPREGEVDGENYFFKSREEFEGMIADNEFLEYAEFCGNYYGTPVGYVAKQLDAGKNVILEIEVKGAFQVKERLPEAVLIFLAPPSLNELESRLVGRGTESAEVVAQRLARAEEELELISDYDYIVINDKVENAADDIRAIVKAECRRANRNKDIINIIKGVD
jgi:guanylate kinase